jgi:hypothetical protein
MGGHRRGPDSSVAHRPRGGGTSRHGWVRYLRYWSGRVPISKSRLTIHNLYVRSLTSPKSTISPRWIPRRRGYLTSAAIPTEGIHRNAFRRALPKGLRPVRHRPVRCAEGSPIKETPDCGSRENFLAAAPRTTAPSSTSSIRRRSMR